MGSKQTKHSHKSEKQQQQQQKPSSEAIPDEVVKAHNGPNVPIHRPKPRVILHTSRPGQSDPVEPNKPEPPVLIASDAKLFDTLFATDLVADLFEVFSLLRLEIPLEIWNEISANFSLKDICKYGPSFYSLGFCQFYHHQILAINSL